MQKYILVQIMRNGKKTANLSSKFNSARTAIHIFMKPYEQLTTIRILIPISSESFVNLKV